MSTGNNPPGKKNGIAWCSRYRRKTGGAHHERHLAQIAIASGTNPEQTDAGATALAQVTVPHPHQNGAGLPANGLRDA
ncbi:MAG: hypothetical protein ACOY3E_04640 [Pseudomonadota bacterium]